jgi:hypothetical protein
MTDAVDRLKTALADRYAIEREPNSGGMATVYLAKDLKLRRKVALKVPRSEPVVDHSSRYGWSELQERLKRTKRCLDYL